MTLTSKFLAVAVATTLLLGGCKGKDGDPGPAGAPAPVLTGSIVGFVAPLDENGQVLSKAGVLVTLANTSPQLAQTTDANGRYEFANVRSGTYNLVFSRADLGTYKVFGFSHVGGDQPSIVQGNYYGNSTPLITPSTVSILNLTAGATGYNPNGGPYVPIDAYFAPNNNNNYFFQEYMLFASTAPGVNSTTGTPLLPSSFSSGSSNSAVSVRLSKVQLNTAGFLSGTRVYAVAYAVPFYLGYSYTEVTTGRVVYPALSSNASPTVSFLVP